eukprot:2460056-Rhodomonas_salina.1
MLREPDRDQVSQGGTGGSRKGGRRIGSQRSPGLHHAGGGFLCGEDQDLFQRVGDAGWTGGL